jgi:hypothetical protein
MNLDGSCLMGRYVLVVGLLLYPGFAPHAAESELTIRQIGSAQVANAIQVGTGHRALVQQNGGIETNGMADDAGIPLSTSFDVYGGADPSGKLVGTRTLDQLLDGLGGGAGSGNRAEVSQRGRDNRALAVQRGSDNILRTEQYGANNLGVHLQTGDGNATALVQRGDGNANALIARGGVVGADGGPLTLKARGGVAGFAVDVAGPQTYSTVTATPNGTGGYSIRLR